jgi:hypothetical protein
MAPRLQWSELSCLRNPTKSTPLTPLSIIAVQGLGSHEFYTWVKKVQSQSAGKPKRFRDRAQFWKGKQRRGKDDSGDDGPVEYMWIRDYLVPMFKDARIATYSYKSDWKDRQVKTSLRECTEQFLNILKQHRQYPNVSS